MLKDLKWRNNLKLFKCYANKRGGGEGYVLCKHKKGTMQSLINKNGAKIVEFCGKNRYYNKY